MMIKNNTAPTTAQNWWDATVHEMGDRITNQQQRHECLHKSCTNCGGTGLSKLGGPCVHMISCPCSQCSPR